MEFEIEIMPPDETDKEPMYALYFNKEKVLVRSELDTILEKIRALVEAFVKGSTETEDKRKK